MSLQHGHERPEEARLVAQLLDQHAPGNVETVFDVVVEEVEGGLFGEVYGLENNLQFRESTDHIYAILVLMSNI